VAKIKVVTDSTSDLPMELASQSEIEVVRNFLVLDGETYRDGEGISREDFYERLPYLRELPTTATASPGEYETLYERLLNQGAEHILSIHAATTLSGIFNAAQAGSQRMRDKVTVVDSQQVSMGLGFQVIAAAKGALEGLSVPKIIQQVITIRERVRVVAMLDSLKYVERSGRVSWAKARLASYLNLRPFIKLEQGRILSLGEARTRQKGIQRLGNMIQELGNLQNLVILHTNAIEEAGEIGARFQSQCKEAVWLCNVTPVIGTHVGPKGLGFAAIVE
jgi:DegV family protein with EDD domain